jgi:hypothetical protein
MSVDFDALTLGPCIDAFGESVSYLSQTSAVPVTFNAVFMSGWDQLIVDQGPNVTVQKPLLGARISDMLGIACAQGDVVTVRGRQYVVREPLPDGVGHIRIMLNYLNPA